MLRDIINIGEIVNTKQLRRKFSREAKRILRPRVANSAKSWQSGFPYGSIYGHNGSIVGKY